MSKVWWVVVVVGIALVMWLVAVRALHEADQDQPWRLSPYPNGHNFAFTIIHDADGAYSERLLPLIDMFTELGFRITVTLFVFPSTVDNDPSTNRTGYQTNVPLTEPSERQFYLTVADRGHEIGMHTPSPRSDTRSTFIRAFEHYREVFGAYPKVYVEHSRRNNKETQWALGADPSSDFYNTDLLNRHGCWVWVDGSGALTDPRHEKFYDVLAARGTPLNEDVRTTYGIAKGFVRSGKWKPSNGDGFLQWYTQAHVDLLEADRGMALVYTHLDMEWLDPQTRQPREAIRKRLEYIAKKDGWFAPAGEILDRYEAMQKVSLAYGDNWVKLVNSNSFAIDGVTLISRDDRPLYRNGRSLSPNGQQEIIVGSLAAHETVAFALTEQGVKKREKGGASQVAD